MTREEAEKYAKNMTYRKAIYNLKQAKSVPYRKATFIKVNELLDELEQDKPMVEIDLYSVIKQKYIEREVIDKIRAELKDNQTDWCYNSDDPVERAYYKAYTRCLKIIDKYTKGEVKNTGKAQSK